MFSTCIRTRPAAMALGMGASGVRSSSSSSSSSIRLPVRTLTTASRVPQAMAVATAAPRLSPPTRTPLWGSIAVFCTGFAAWATHTSVHCEEPAPSPAPAAENRDPLPDPSQPPPPKSIIDAKQLGFGTVAGICAGVFVKKGLKAIAFALGGVYILLQYLSSQNWISINWSAMASKYDSVIDVAAGGPEDPASQHSSRAWRIWQRFAHFLTHNFQERATFLAGFVLGVRMG